MIMLPCAPAVIAQVPHPRLVIDSSCRNDADIVDILEDAQRSVFICVRRLDDPLIGAEIKKVRERRVKVVVEIFPIKRCPPPMPLDAGPGEVVCDERLEWIGSSDWSLNGYKNSAVWFELSDELSLRWKKFLSKVHA